MADNPPLSKDHAGYKLMREFVEKRVKNRHEMFRGDALDELLRIGGGLFRETARAIRDAAYMAISRNGDRIEPRDAERVFNQVKKEYQPIIRGEAVGVLKRVLNSAQGWVEGVEPFLQSRAVVEYENGDLWLDVRHVLKPYIRTLDDDTDFVKSP